MCLPSLYLNLGRHGGLPLPIQEYTNTFPYANYVMRFGGSCAS